VFTLVDCQPFNLLPNVHHTHLSSSIPFFSARVSLLKDIPVLCFPSSSALDFSLVHFTFAFALVPVIVSASALIVPVTASVHACKFRNMTEVLGNNHIGTPVALAPACDVFVHRLRLAQHAPHTARFVFDPGGFIFVLVSALEDARERKLKRYDDFTIRDAPSFTSSRRSRQFQLRKP